MKHKIYQKNVVCKARISKINQHSSASTVMDLNLMITPPNCSSAASCCFLKLFAGPNYQSCTRHGLDLNCSHYRGNEVQHDAQKLVHRITDQRSLLTYFPIICHRFCLRFSFCQSHWFHLCRAALSAIPETCHLANRPGGHDIYQRVVLPNRTQELCVKQPARKCFTKFFWCTSHLQVE